MRHQCYQAVTFKSSQYSQIEFDFDSTFNPNPTLLDSLPVGVKYDNFTTFHLNKQVIRRIGTTTLWMEISSFWIDNSQEIYASGNIFAKSDNLYFSLPILTNKNQFQHIKYKDLYHVNDFLYVLNDQIVLINGII